MSIPNSTWETVIGLEIHIQLNTVSKAFCADEARFSNDPNTQTSVISLAHPGTLPKPNAKQIEKAVRLGLAMNSTINKASYFERKQYFYPDLPKGYQISQQASPICIGGHIILNTSSGEKKIRLHHIHMEEDAGKSIHDSDPIWSKIDLNRAGVPLLEMVTEPDFSNAEEVSVFLTELQRLVRYLQISDANMEEGSMRCDVNVSVRPTGTTELRERCEIKNVNSRRFARRAIEFEVKRQIQLWSSGQKVVRQTMQYIPEEDITAPIRQKESAHDYRYFPDPDLPPILIEQEYIQQIAATLPVLPQKRMHQLVFEYHISAADATMIIDDALILDYYFQLVHDRPRLNKLAATWLVQQILPFLSENKITLDSFPIDKMSVLHLLNAIQDQQVSIQQAKEIWASCLSNPAILMSEQIQQKTTAGAALNYTQIVEEVFTAHPEETKEFKAGKKKLVGFFLGEIKKKYPEVNIKEVQKLLG